MKKQILRAQYKKKRSLIPGHIRRTAPEKIVAVFEEYFPGRSFTGKTVLVYLPLRDELDTRPLIRNLRRNGAVIAVPCVMNNRIVPCIYNKGARLTAGKFGIKEPAVKSKCRTSSISAVLAPGLAFDKSGTRLGFGGGYFDRFLSSLKHRPVKFGVCFSAQLAPSLPAMRHDVRMNFIITEKGCIPCGKKA